MYKLRMIMVLASLNVLGGIWTLPTLQNDNQDTDTKCITKQNIQRYERKHSNVPDNESERKQYCLVDESYLYLDIYPCDDFFQWSVKQECLMCGQRESRPKPICQTGRDDPSKVLTCEYCRRFANPCQNHGKAICGARSYASDLRCNCTSGYSGTFCEKEEVVYICGLNDDDGTELRECNGKQFTDCKMTFNGRDYRCNLKEGDDDDETLPRCETVTLPMETDSEYSADGMPNTEGGYTLLGNLVSQPINNEIGFSNTLEKGEMLEYFES